MINKMTPLVMQDLTTNIKISVYKFWKKNQIPLGKYANDNIQVYELADYYSISEVDVTKDTFLAVV